MRSLFAIIILAMFSCRGEQILIPKPRIYPKITFPEKEYQPLNIPACPFEMEVPSYFKYISDTHQNVNEQKHKCWFDLYCEELNTYLHFSYIDFNERKQFDELVADAFEMVDKHNIKASYRDELRINKSDEKVHGVLFNIDGPVATPLQFYLTDSLSHFLRGSLYFKASVNRDSIAPIYEFFKEDIDKMLSSFEWE